MQTTCRVPPCAEPCVRSSKDGSKRVARQVRHVPPCVAAITRQVQSGGFAWPNGRDDGPAVPGIGKDAKGLALGYCNRNPVGATVAGSVDLIRMSREHKAVSRIEELDDPCPVPHKRGQQTPMLAAIFSFEYGRPTLRPADHSPAHRPVGERVGSGVGGPGRRRGSCGLRIWGAARDQAGSDPRHGGCSEGEQREGDQPDRTSSPCCKPPR
jgi:hypothetical protein